MVSSHAALSSSALAAGLFLLLGAQAVAQPDILLQLEAASPAGDRFVVDSAGGFVAHGNLNHGTAPATGVGMRLMWYPGMGAFRAGYVTGPQWDDASIGLFSTAAGFNITASGYYSTAMGSNTVASGSHSIAMGFNTRASGAASIALGYSTIASGHRSLATGYLTTAEGDFATAMGYATVASGDFSTAMGQITRASGQYSTAMGRRASTDSHEGSFVYGDATGTGTDTVRASAANQATWRTTGGFRILTTTGLTTGCFIEAGGSAWNCTSSRLEKENFAEVDGEDVLRRLRSVPVTSWNGIAEGPRVRHIGPMAQDWHAAFALNDDPLTIHQGDLAGVSLAAVQALDGRTRGVPEMEERIRALEAENGALWERVEALSADAESLRDAAALRAEDAALRAEVLALRSEAAAQLARLERLEALAGPRTREP
jgi:trimeric autotransporter adhesin